MVRKLIAALVIVGATCFVSCSDRPNDSKVTKIHVPYRANSIYYPYPFGKGVQGRKVMVPVQMDTLPSLYLSDKTKTEQAPLVNFFEGAYPVYYTAGHANGHFTGKIVVLK